MRFGSLTLSEFIVWEMQEKLADNVSQPAWVKVQLELFAKKGNLVINYYPIFV